MAAGSAPSDSHAASVVRPASVPIEPSSWYSDAWPNTSRSSAYAWPAPGAETGHGGSAFHSRRVRATASVFTSASVADHCSCDSTRLCQPTKTKNSAKPATPAQMRNAA
jgi:hypothetical protein